MTRVARVVSCGHIRECIGRHVRHRLLREHLQCSAQIYASNTAQRDTLRNEE